MKIRELLSDESKWTQEVLALDFDNRPADAGSPYAICWCLDGAMQRCYVDKDLLLVQAKLENALGVGRYGYIDWNDAPDRVFADVKALVERLDV